MANLNPLQNLQSRDSLIFANQPTLDSSKSNSDQGLTSFPDELRAAKQQTPTPASDTPRAESKSTQAPEEKPQNLPPSTDQGQQDAANIAAPQANASEDTPPAKAQVQADVPPTPGQGVDQATLGQVEVALAVEAKAATVADTLAVVDASLSTVVVDGTSKAALAKAAADAAALQAGAAVDQTQAVVTASVDTTSNTAPVSVSADILQSKTTKDNTSDSATADAPVVLANPIAIAGVVQIAAAPIVQAAQVVSSSENTASAEIAQVSAANTKVATLQASANDALVGVDTQAVSAADGQSFSATLNQAAANVAAAPTQVQNGSTAVEAVKTTPGQAVQVSATVAAQVQVNTEQLAANSQTNAAQNLPVDQVVIQKIELPTAQAAVNVAASPAVQNAVQSVVSAADGNVTDQVAVTNASTTSTKPADQAIAQAAPKTVNLPTVEESGFAKQVRSQNAENFVAASVVAKQERSTRVVAKDDTVSQSSSNGINATDAKQTSFISNLNNEVKLTQSSTLKLEPQNASLATGPLNSEVMRVLKEGGGRVVMEVTPPDQGTIRIDLRLDNQGRAIVVVDGASDSTRARLEQGSAQLKEQLAQMGLSLSLDMRQQSNNAGQSQFMAEGIAFGNSNNSSGVAANADIAAGILGTATPAADGRINLYA